MNANRLSYERLEYIAKTDRPYRGTTNHYPIHNRKHSYKRFSAEIGKDGNVEFHIYYGYSLTKIEVSAERYAKERKHSGGTIYDELYKTTKYYIYKRDWTEVGVVRKDNTFELTATNLYQGTRYFLASMFNNYRARVIASVKHGGTIYCEYEGGYNVSYANTKVIPLFKGQRIDLETNSSVLNYEVHTHKVNRARSKEVLAEYDAPLKFTELVFKTMTREVFHDSLIEVFKEALPEGMEGGYWRDDRARKVMDYATAQVKGDMFKAICATMIGEKIYQARSIVAGYTHYYPTDYIKPEDYYRVAKQKIVKYIRRDSSAFDVKVYKANEAYPSSNWDIYVKLDGKNMQTY